MNNKVWLGVGVAALIGVFSFFRGGTPGPQGPQGDPGKTVVGAVSGPDRTFPTESRNGIHEQFNQAAFKDATSTICGFRSPAATSSLTFASLKISTATSTAVMFDIAQSRDQSATTTLITSLTIASDLGLDWVSTSTVGVVGTTIFGPNRYLNFNVGGTNIPSGDGALEGTCQAIFTVL